MKKFLGLVVAFLFLGAGVAVAHQPVVLQATDTSAEKGPLLVDGTVSFAVRASFNKAGEKRAFRAQLKDRDVLAVQYLIVDKRPENAMRNSLLPVLVITGPAGFKQSIKFTERTKFYEPWGQTNYLYLARFSAPASAGIYNFVATAKAKAAITIAVGEKEIVGEVLRGVVPEVKVSASPAPSASVAATPAPTVTASPSASASAAGYTMADVRANSSARSCWSAINGNVYDLTRWINSHPGGAGAIQSLCGIDGSAAFAGQHSGQAKPESRLAGYLLGPLVK